MIGKHKSWKSRWTFLAVLLCVGVSFAMVTRFHFVEVQAGVTEEQPENVMQPSPAAEPESEPKTREPVPKGVTPTPVKDLPKIDTNCRVILPEGASTQGFTTKANGVHDSGPGSGWTHGGGGVESDGTFDFDFLPDTTYMVGVFDTKNRFVAPLKRIKTGKEPSTEVYEFTFEEGTQLTAKFLDKESGEPIPGLRIVLGQKWSKKAMDRMVDFDQPSDSQGLFETKLLPGEYVIAVDHRISDAAAIRAGVYAKKFTIEKGKPVSLEFRIPTPFVGKVVNSDGSPVDAGRFVMVNPNSFTNGSFTHTKTDENGVFRCTESPTDCTINVMGYGGQEQYFAWHGNEFKSLKEAEFKLVAPTEISGRLLDAKTKEPLKDRLFFYWKRNPEKPTQFAFMPDNARTDGEGRFTIFLNPTLKYDMFLVHGRNDSYGGGPYTPRIDLAELDPKSDTDLGDLLVDSSQAKERSDKPSNAGGRIFEGEDAERMKRGLEISEIIKSGKKKSVLKIFVREKGRPVLDYLLKHKDEEPLKSFEYIIRERNEPSKEELKEYEELKEQFKDDEKHSIHTFDLNAPAAIFLDPWTNSFEGAEDYHLTLAQLRGEKASRWNVASDASENGDWKNDPGQCNPAILNNFLQDHLAKIAEKDIMTFDVQIMEGDLNGIMEGKLDDTVKGFVFAASKGSIDVLRNALEERAKENKLRIVSRPQIRELQNQMASMMVGSPDDNIIFSFTYNQPKGEDLMTLEFSLEKKTGSSESDKLKGQVLLTDGYALVAAGNLDGKKYIVIVTVVEE